MQPCRVKKRKEYLCPGCTQERWEGSNSGSEWPTKNGRQRDHTEQLGSSVNHGQELPRSGTRLEWKTLSHRALGLKVGVMDKITTQRHRAPVTDTHTHVVAK